MEKQLGIYSKGSWVRVEGEVPHQRLRLGCYLCVAHAMGLSTVAGLG